MCHQDKLVPPVCLYNAANLATHLVLEHCLGRQPGAYGHDLEGNDAHLPVRVRVLVGVEMGQEVDVRVEANTDAVDEQDGEP